MIFLMLVIFLFPYLISSLGAYLWVRKQFNTQWKHISPEVDTIIIMLTPFVNTGITIILLMELLFIDDITKDKWIIEEVKREKSILDKFFGIKVKED